MKPKILVNKLIEICDESFLFCFIVKDQSTFYRFCCFCSLEFFVGKIIGKEFGQIFAFVINYGHLDAGKSRDPN